MHPRRSMRSAMALSRGLVLGRVWTHLRHLALGGCALSLGMMALTGHVGAAIGSVVGLYLLSKAFGVAVASLRRKLLCR